ncbi:hypothetical protein THMIRHAS_16670 [Thiosulfatimonas sediminis]|uniref:Uncharacterized protein n=1 Tax=Thiosulfatimonas sediminis TaxID=2675054 RepID=A0A6F8PWB5_9GAMM|nr:DUF6710 family protein [Thiosulfatimonas sediminis]BBP46294.1 hypothetical protein THMIRHAS_16670 [Thiosulfatimonas sediminis]
MFKFRNKKIDHKKKQFRNLVNLGLQIYKENPNALQAYINGLARKVQYQRFVDYAMSDMHAAPHNRQEDFFGRFFNKNAEYELLERLRSDPPEQMIDLSTDTVIAEPWHHGRFISCMETIGEPENPWKEHKTNHLGFTFLPSKITWIGGGNHSITTGILKNTGTFQTTEVYDLSKIFDSIYSDGIFFWNKDAKERISQVIFLEFAAIYEIERQVRRVQ